ncbi:RNA 2',3'-cyclic phosphodiesterase [compost metagenome]
MMTAASARAMRLFIAIPIPAPAAHALQEWVAASKPYLPFRKWTHPRDYHITLQFLGDVSGDQVDALHSALRAVRSCAIRLALNGFGIFGSPKAPRVLWAAADGELDRLTLLHQAIIEATGALGYKAEDRPYAPHITLARGFDGERQLDYANTGMNSNGTLPFEAKARAPRGFAWEADRFVLMRTHMHASPMYEIIGEYPLLL